MPTNQEFTQKKVLKVHPADNVIVALVDIEQGETLVFEGEAITTVTPVKAKHKIAAVELTIGASIYMYGVLIGKASQLIQKGAF